MSKYYYVDGQGQRKGPFRVEQMQNLNLDPNTLVWANGMTDWVKASSISELNMGDIPPIPQPLNLRSRNTLLTNLIIILYGRSYDLLKKCKKKEFGATPNSFRVKRNI